jgi:hypothetical protein
MSHEMPGTAEWVDRDSDSVQIVAMDEAREDNVALLFARAFQDDPILVRTCPDADKRARWLPWLFRCSTWPQQRLLRPRGNAAGDPCISTGLPELGHATRSSDSLPLSTRPSLN